MVEHDDYFCFRLFGRYYSHQQLPASCVKRIGGT